MDDRTAIRRLKRGDIGGLGVLVERYQVEAAHTAYLITRDVYLADDVLQESFLRVYRYIHHFDESRPFAPYLMRIVANLAIDACKGDASRDAHQLTIDADSFAARFPDTLHNPENESEAAELKRAVSDALQTLTPEQRAAVVLRYFHDYSEREVADALREPQGTISWRLHRARKQLGNLLRGFWNPEVSGQEG